MKYPKYSKYKDSGVEWIGEIPEDWTVTKLKFISLISADYGINISADNYIDKGVRFIRITDINEDGTLKPEGVFIREDLSKGKILERGDLLFARSGSVGTSFLFTLTDSQKYSFAGYLVRFRFRIGYSPSFVYLFSQSKLFKDQIKMNSIETTIENFNGDKYSNLKICLPNIKIQEHIVSRLNIIFNDINSLIVKISKMIDLLKEKRQAIITHAVTKGLDPNVPMKDSGVEWIGEIPEHWNVQKLRRSFQVLNGSTPRSDNQLYWDGNIIWVTPEDLSLTVGPFIDESSRHITPEGYHSCGTNLVPKGSIIVSTRAPIGYVKIARVELCTNQGCRSLVKKTVSDEKYFFYYLSCFAGVLNSFGQGSTFVELSSEKLKMFQATIPPIGEQISLTRFLDYETSKIDSLIVNNLKLIDLLKEYKYSIITQAVTGKIDVRGLTVPVESNSSEA